MPRGSQQPRKNIEYVKFEGKYKDAAGVEVTTDPRFSFSRPAAAGGVEGSGFEKEFGGYLQAIGHGSYRWKDDTINTIKILLVDDKTVYKLEMNQDSNHARGVMNKLLSLDKPGFLWFRTYLSKPNEKGDRFAQIYIENDKKACGWRFDYEKDLKPLIQMFPDPKKPEKLVPNYSKINSLLMDDWKKFEPIVKANAEALGITDSVTPPPPPTNRVNESTQIHDQASDEAKKIANNLTREEIENTGPKDDLPDDLFAPEGDDLPF